jgi:prolyl-tRNA synthetase
MKAAVINEAGALQTMLMGCYGLGITRVVAAAIEQHHDQNGIIWPQNIAPFQLVIIPINAQRSVVVREAAEKLYQELTALGLDILLDDRNERPGVLFADSDLIGIPHRLVVSERNLEQGSVEYKARNGNEASLIPMNELISFISKL